jgi:uncharacterized protein
MLRTLRLFLLVVLLPVAVPWMLGESVATLPGPTGYVNDFAGVLSPETRQSLEDLCTQVDQQAHAQIAVVTVKSMDPDKSGATPSIEEFATALEDKWKVGKKGTDRGVLLIVSENPRKYRIEVGYGLEGLLNDAKVGDIGRDMQPSLHANDYNQGITAAVHELAQDIAADAGVNLGLSSNGEAAVPQTYSQPPPQQGSPIGALIIGGIVLVVIAIMIGTGHIGLLFFLLFNMLGGGGGRGGGDFGGGGGGGGGFGGFGGGSSGGGGASGDF